MNEVRLEPLSICLVNYDWRDIYRTDKNELREKLERDQLRPDINKFFFYSWAKQSYREIGEQWETVHQCTYGLHAFRPILNVWALVSIPRAMRNKGHTIDIWATYDFGMGPALWICKKLYGGRLVVILNNQPKIYSETRSFGKIKGLYSWVIERIGARLVDHMFTINKTLKKYGVAIGVKNERITIFSMNTILRDRVDIEQTKKSAVRNQHALGADVKILISAARFEAEKNWPRSLELFSKLPEDHVLFCLGRGSLEAKLKQQVKELGVERRVFFPGFIQRKDIWNYYLDADVFVLLSKAEALGIVFWEAMHVGLPVIGSDVEGIVESIGADGERGRIWREADGVEGYKERVQFCVTQSDERNAMVARAKQFVDARIQNTVTINDVPGVYRSLE